MSKTLFHKYNRLLYRACRRKYGLEKVQNECLKIFYIVYPEQYRLEQCNDEFAEIPPEVVERLLELFRGWNATGKLKEQIDQITETIQLPFSWKREELITFYKDITPVAMRIRKLIPRECFRLMDCDEEAIEVLVNCGLADSPLYHLAGNSICVGVMTAIFDRLFIHTEPKFAAGTQLTLF